MSSQAESMVRGTPLRLAPEMFQVELSAWINFGEPPEDPLLWAILCGDLFKAFAYGSPNYRNVAHATVMWLLNFAPPGCYGSAEAVTEWAEHGGLHRIAKNGRKA